ncbi:endonuclease/exonuclease/phosphatase family protein [Flavobacterium silvaticum]|uniref:Endonuclease/exonuclease/phosphatase family protein n=1 Tax=Flavobacterium silvaticum TaxID=1852020 RepID=A0A972JH80_9FLAO|nr:endonuclease/exonuclease/phosphatase family protein [Flavobacterium silvaticum]NMH28961.1 endonuclease/exonuclease/phosphatase family protein [Flavobacterium silvaticum]
MTIKIPASITFLLLAVSCFSQQLSVMTYNIRVDFGGDGENNWQFRRDFLADQINYNNPDFMGTQEGKYHQLHYLDSLMTHHSWFGISRDNSKTEGEFSAIFYNTDKFRLVSENTFWLSETPDKPSKGWDGAYPRICTYGLFEDKTSQKRFYVFNTHLDHIGELARSNGVKLILERMKSVNTSKLPVIVTGDFNSEMSSGAYKTMVSELIDTRSFSREKPFGPSGTFNGFKFNEPVKMLIDYIFVSKGIDVEKYAVLSDSRDCRYPSDHLPVLAELKIK